MISTHGKNPTLNFPLRVFQNSFHITRNPPTTSSTIQFSILSFGCDANNNKDYSDGYEFGSIVTKDTG